MERLGTDYVDLYYLHRLNLDVPVEEVAGAMGRLIDEGLIRGWGLSQVGVGTISAAQAVTPVSAVQNIYSMVERDVEKEVIPYCLENRIGVVPFSPIASGFLSGKITADTQFEKITADTQFEKVDDVRNWVPQLKKENIIATSRFSTYWRTSPPAKRRPRPRFRWPGCSTSTPTSSRSPAPRTRSGSLKTSGLRRWN